MKKISFNDAKEKNFYDYYSDYTISELQNLDTIEEILRNNVPVVLEFGNIDIEILVTEADNGKLDIRYFICVRDSELKWHSLDYTLDRVKITENLEEDMFNILMKFANENNLHWNKGNDHLSPEYRI